MFVSDYTENMSSTIDGNVIAIAIRTAIETKITAID